jgi:Na+-driven multidrug efflux pump
LAATYVVGLPAAVGLGLFAPRGFFGVFVAKALEEGIKAGCFLLRFLRGYWYEHAMKEERGAKDNVQQSEDQRNESEDTCAV